MGLANESTNHSKMRPLENVLKVKALINSEIFWGKNQLSAISAFQKVFSLDSKIPGKLQVLQILLLKIEK